MRADGTWSLYDFDEGEVPIAKEIAWFTTCDNTREAEYDGHDARYAPYAVTHNYTSPMYSLTNPHAWAMLSNRRA